MSEKEMLIKIYEEVGFVGTGIGVVLIAIIISTMLIINELNSVCKVS